VSGDRDSYVPKGVELAYHIHAVTFGVVMVLLVLIWAAVGFGYPWPIWPLITWGPFVGLHAWVTYGLVPRLTAGSS